MFQRFKRHLKQNSRAENMPVVAAGRLVYLLISIHFETLSFIRPVTKSICEVANRSVKLQIDLWSCKSICEVANSSEKLQDDVKKIKVRSIYKPQTYQLNAWKKVRREIKPISCKLTWFETVEISRRKTWINRESSESRRTHSKLHWNLLHEKAWSYIWKRALVFREN